MKFTATRRTTVRTAVALAGVATLGLALPSTNGEAATGPETSPPAASAQEARTISAQEGQTAHNRHSARIPRVAAAWAKAWNNADPRAMASLFTENGVYQDNAFQVAMTGPEGVATWVNITGKSIANTHVRVMDAFQQGNRIAVRWEFSGTDTGAFAKDRPATGKSFTVPATTVIDLKNGKIQQLTDYYNLADLLRQVGLPAGVWTPPPAQ
ncbi:ester cyclase [Streptomyces sp. AD55]|uniref:ester cyclase n=1 Tax=Streptomyces sp. AD55 TaxID=3242895 RepID=UPI00352878F7